MSEIQHSVRSWLAALFDPLTCRAIIHRYMCMQFRMRCHHKLVEDQAHCCSAWVNCRPHTLLFICSLNYIPFWVMTSPSCLDYMKKLGDIITLLTHVSLIVYIVDVDMTSMTNPLLDDNLFGLHCRSSRRATTISVCH